MAQNRPPPSAAAAVSSVAAGGARRVRGADRPAQSRAGRGVYRGGRPVLIGTAVQARFVAALARGETVEAAAREVGFSVSALYYRRRADPLFAEAWDLAAEASAITPRAPGRPKRRLRLTPARRARFLAVLGRDANTAAAARAALVHVATVYRTADRDPAFAAETEAALRRAYAALEEASISERAAQGARLMAGLDSPAWGPDGIPPAISDDFETVMRLLNRYTRPAPPAPGRRRRGQVPPPTFEELLEGLERKLALLMQNR